MFDKGWRVGQNMRFLKAPALVKPEGSDFRMTKDMPSTDPKRTFGLLGDDFAFDVRTGSSLSILLPITLSFSTLIDRSGRRAKTGGTSNSNGPKTTADVINQAIKENRTVERVLYTLMFLVIAAGVAVLVGAIVKNRPILAVLGVLITGLFWPVLQRITQIRRENLAIRLLESPLNRAETSGDAAEALLRFVQQQPNAKPDRSRPERASEESRIKSGGSLEAE